MRDLVTTQKAVQQTGPDNSKACAPIPSRATRTLTSLLRLQQMMGNQAGQRMMKNYSEDRLDCSIQADSFPAARHFDGESLNTVASVKLQPKLEINARGDIYEQEADRVADQIVGSRESRSIDSPPSIHRLSRDNHNRQAGHALRALESSAAPESELSPATETSVRSLDSGGKPLDMALRSFFEPRFGHSFEDVRVHTDSSAAASARDLKARAYTRGRHIVFAPGHYEPQSERGQRLLAHELTHVVQQGWSGHESIQRAYVAPAVDETATIEVPTRAAAVAAEEDEAQRIQRAPDTPDAPATPAPADPAQAAPAVGSPTINFSPGNTIVRGDTITASVAFTPVAGETIRVTDWQYTTASGDVVTRPQTEAKFQSEWKGKMALSGNLKLSYTMKPRGKPEVPGTPVTSPVTVNDRTGPNWQTTITDNAEVPLTGAPSPPELARQLGVHDILPGLEPTGVETAISSGPNTGFTFLDSMGDRNYVSQPRINPEVDNAGSAFRVFHRNASRLYFRSNTGVRTLVPQNEYTVVRVSGSRMSQFNVPDWTAFYKKYGVLTLTVSAGANSMRAQDGWWSLQPNTEAGTPTITNPGAVRAALRIGARDNFNITVAANGAWESPALMPSAQIPAGTRSHEFAHATHSHRANLHKILRALDPRRLMESSVSTPSNPVVFADKIRMLLGEIRKPDHELVDEAGSRAAGRFVPVSGATMAAINQDPVSGASLGVLWDITHDRPLG